MRQWTARPTASRRSLPDFLIVGGQRCGTTSRLPVPHAAPVGAVPAADQGHALVRRGVPAAPRPGTARTSRSTRSAAGASSRDRRSGPRRRGAAPTTCSTRRCPPASPEHLPDTKVIAILRDPVARAWSAYHHEYRRGYETPRVRGRPRRRAGIGSPAPTRCSPRARPGTSSHQHHGVRRPGPLRRAARADVDPRRPRSLPRAVHRRPRARPGRRDAAGARLPRDPVRDPPPRPGAGTARTPLRSPPSCRPVWSCLRAVRRVAGRAPRGPPPWRT